MCRWEVRSWPFSADSSSLPEKQDRHPFSEVIGEGTGIGLDMTKAREDVEIEFRLKFLVLGNQEDLSRVDLQVF